MKKILTIATLFFLASCAAFVDRLFPNFPDSNDFINRFGENKKGVVVFQFSSKYPATTWCKTSLEKEILEANCFDIKPTKYYQIFMLEPGWYEIAAYEKDARRYGKNSLNQRFSNESQKRVSKPQMAFLVIQNQISFLGKIDYRSSYKVQKTSQNQDFEEIKKALFEQDEKKLRAIFKGHKFEAKILAKKATNENFVKDLVKEEGDFVRKKGVIYLK